MVEQSESSYDIAQGDVSTSSISPITSNSSNQSPQSFNVLGKEMNIRDQGQFVGDKPVTPKCEPLDLHLHQDFERRKGLDTADEIEDLSFLGLDLTHGSAEDALHQQLFGIRRQRQFILASAKDGRYWDRRKRNNAAAKRSREKRRFNDRILESRVMELTKENNLLGQN